MVFGARFELATMRFSTARVYQLRHPNIGGQSRIRTLDVSRRVTRSTARRFQPLSQLPKHELSKIWRKAGDSNAYVPRDPGLADQWDTNYPSLPGKNYNLDLKEITDLVRDTKSARLRFGRIGGRD